MYRHIDHFIVVGIKNNVFLQFEWQMKTVEMHPLSICTMGTLGAIFGTYFGPWQLIAVMEHPLLMTGLCTHSTTPLPRSM